MIKTLKRKSISILAATLVAFMCLLCFYVPVSADVGPKASIKIKVKNPPEGGYVVALLSKETGVRPDDNEKNVYNKDGYTVFYSPVGKNIQQRNDEGVYFFHYMVPKSFKVLLITDDGREYVSNEITRKAFDATCTFDVEAGTLKEELFAGPMIISRLIGIIICYSVTILTEMLVLLMFSYPIKKNLKKLFFINTVTQVFLNVVISFSGNLLIWAAAELVIVIVEAIYYSNRLVNRKGENKRGRNVGYAVAANLFSVIHELPVALIVNFILWYLGWR